MTGGPLKSPSPPLILALNIDYIDHSNFQSNISLILPNDIITCKNE